MPHTELSAGRLRDLLDYDPATGVFTWRVFVKGTRGKGAVAGYTRPDGYQIIVVDKCRYLSHRLAWLWMTGAWPSDMLDHADRNPANNAFANLREATRSQNMANAAMKSTNRTGLKGVVMDRRDGRYAARIQKQGKPKSLGYFDCPAAAHFAYVVEANHLFGEFARAS